jgi:hypothetical protein
VYRVYQIAVSFILRHTFCKIQHFKIDRKKLSGGELVNQIEVSYTVVSHYFFATKTIALGKIKIIFKKCFLSFFNRRLL